MPRAEVIIGFAPEDRDLIARILDAQDRELSRHQEHLMQARVLAQDARQRTRDAEARAGHESTRARQMTTLLETARSVAGSALAGEGGRSLAMLREALYSITQL
jgi:hypothetical protein